ncbi:MAG: efflux RND transporter permease subunit [Desulfitobacteriaceae bacterium]|nr:efflux RND transporter permease subunit [Desulfitobacteriaceae bacterium]MDI6879705.1 efflux RND transporter permease subunit [Desulfitobacteriaceae bacterium]MDI6915150.1 efflux RND transporter permease subunit [Desulfitobacteriaceae bacterium]
MDRLTRFALKNPTVIFFLIALILFGGVYSAGQMKTEAMPDVKIPYVVVSTLYPGASPDDVLQAITKPIEKATTGIKGLKIQESHSVDSMSILVLQFDFSTDMDQAERQIQESVNKLTLPDQAQKPKVSRVSFDDSPILVLSASGGKSTAELEQVMRDKVQPALSGIDGVGTLDVEGLSDSNIYVKVDPQKLKDNNLTLDNIRQALVANNISFPAGEVNMENKTMPLRVAKKVMSVDDIKNIPIVIPPNVNQAMGETLGQMGSSLGQMGKAVSGMAQGMGSIGQQLGVLGQGMGQLGQGVGNATQGTALVAQIQLTQVEIDQLKQKMDALLKAGTPATDPNVVGLQTQIQQKSGILVQLNQSLLGWLNQQKQAAPSGQSSGATNPGSLAASASSTTALPAAPSNTEIVSPDLAIKTAPLGEIATVLEGTSVPSSFTRTDEKPSVVLNVLKDGDANTVELAKNIQNKLSELKSQLPDGIAFTTLYDQSKDIKASVNGTLREGLLGALFAVIVIAVFLRNVRATVVAVVSIPLSVLTALILLPRFNVTLNMMTLGGLTVAVGRVVDDSIVVIENIYRRLQLTPPEGHGPKLVWEATKEVGAAITYSTITTVAVFAPLALVSGIVSKFFYPFALTVVMSLLASLLVALTVVPMLSKYMLLKQTLTVEHEGALQRLYKRILNWSLSHRLVIVLTSILLLALAASLVTRLPVQFVPSDQTKALTIKQVMTAGTSLDMTNKTTQDAEKILAAIPEVKTVQDTVGSNKSQMGMNFNIQGSDEAKYMIVLDNQADVDQTISTIRSRLKTLETGGTRFFVNALTTTAPSDTVEVIVNGPNLAAISQAATLITDEIRNIPDLVNVTNNLAVVKPEISIHVNAEKAGEQGYSPIMVAGLIRSMLTNTSVTSIENNNQTVNVMLSLKQDDLNSLEKISNLELPGIKGNIKLSEIAEIQKAPGPVSITQRNGSQFANITAGIMGHNTQGVTKAVLAKIEAQKAKFPAGISYSLGGANESIEEGFSQMGVAIAVAVAMVYLVLMIAFSGALVPLAILFSLPFAAVGGFLALILAHQALSMPALIGMLMLIGIVVTNAIVLVDRVQRNRRQGMDVREALLEAGSIRLRPILMTAIATIMALLPLALGFSEGTLISVNLGVTVIGGLTLSTLLTLVVVPVVYSYFEGLRSRFSKGSPTEAENL